MNKSPKDVTKDCVKLGFKLIAILARTEVGLVGLKYFSNTDFCEF